MTAADYFARVSLDGTRTRLLPLEPAHVDDLAAVGSDPSIWQWMPTAHHAPGSMRAFVESALALRDARKAVPFATLDKSSGRIAGATRFHFIEPDQRRLEIGVTWVGRDFQRSHVNTEAKFLQMWYALEVLGCRRVEWKADAANARSRAAILRLGATEEGLFRQHMIYPDGRNRDSVYFSILDREWPAVKDELQRKLGYAVTPTVTLP